MSVWLLYLLLLKATLTSFSGLASLPVIQRDLVEHHHVLTHAEIDAAIVISRTTPGPVGLYVVSIGYAVGGWPGAVAGWLAMITPALVIIPLLGVAARHMHHPRAQQMTRAVIAGSAGLMLAAALPMAESSLTGPIPIAIAAVSLVVLLATRLESVWIILAAGLAGLLQSLR